MRIKHRVHYPCNRFDHPGAGANSDAVYFPKFPLGHVPHVQKN